MKPNAALALKRTAQSHSAKARLLSAETIAPLTLVPVAQDAALDKVTHPAELAQAETAAPQEAQALSLDTSETTGVTTAAPEATAVVTAEEPQYLAGQAGADLAAATGGTGLPMGVVVAGLTGVALIGVGNDAAATPGVTKTGTPDADVLEGGAGKDTLSGLAGDDVLKGNGGDDVLNGGLGSNTLDGGANNDTAIYVNQYSNSASPNQVQYLAPTSDISMLINLNTGIAVDYFTHFSSYSTDSINDVLISIENVTTGSGHDTVVMAGNGVVNVGDGYNYVYTSTYYSEGSSGAVTGDHTIIGGDDGNTLYLSGADNNVVTLGNGYNYIYAYGDTGNNNITTGAGYDYISLGEGSNTVSSGAGDDEIELYSGAAVINGGEGEDTVSFYGDFQTIDISNLTNIEVLEIQDGSSQTLNLTMASIFNMTSADVDENHSLYLYFDFGINADVISFDDLTETFSESNDYSFAGTYTGTYQGHAITVHAFGNDYYSSY